MSDKQWERLQEFLPELSMIFKQVLNTPKLQKRYRNPDKQKKSSRALKRNSLPEKFSLIFNGCSSNV